MKRRDLIANIMNQRAAKLEELRRKKEKVLSRMNAQIAEAQRVEDYRQRKEDTRHKIILGACLLVDLENHPELGATLETSLLRTASPRDAEFLRTKGWRI